LIAGKGHENYQEFADHTIPFDDIKSRDVRSKIIQWSFYHDIFVWEFADTRRGFSNSHVMNPLPLSQIAQLAGGLLSADDGTVAIDKLSTDSRTISAPNYSSRCAVKISMDTIS